MTRRRRAVVEFLVSALGLVLQAYVLKHLTRRDDYDGPPAVSPTGLVAGILYQFGFHAAHDRDVARIRTDRYRGFAVGLCSGLVRRRLPSDGAFRYGFDTGGLVGMVLYRFWYGVLRPVPGEER
ncbi:hypothetical protein [Halorussus halobius]|uniref:hypothetical protein n=1 Tax=Halorussus halobius TaxID=1710537 RepID=UPI001092BE83|nr:hypothetical protein [Halorussus halobius]